MTTQQVLSSIDDLFATKYAIELDAVVVNTARFKTRGLLPHAIKYGLWALREGGILTIHDDGPYKAELFEVSFEAVRPLVRRLLYGEAELVEMDENLLRMVFRRTRPILGPGWSAGIVFSGNEGEIPALYNCLDGLLLQPELVGETGEIVVCGPKRDLGILADYPQVRYVVFEIPPDQVFPISQKKNFLASQLNYSRAVLLHARIVLDEGCLSKMPLEFDAAAPTVSVYIDGERRPYLDYVIGERFDPSRPSRRFNEHLAYPRGRYLEFLDTGYPYIDGGCIFVRTELLAEIPFHPALKWSDQEDAEWCSRLQVHGKLVDLIPDATAITQGNKMGRSVAPSTWDLTRKPFRRMLRYGCSLLRLWGLKVRKVR